MLPLINERGFNEINEISPEEDEYLDDLVEEEVDVFYLLNKYL